MPDEGEKGIFNLKETGMIPKVHLSDPGVEPSDEELEALSEAALADAVERHRAAEVRFQSRMNAALEESLRRAEEDRLVAGP